MEPDHPGRHPSSTGFQDDDLDRSCVLDDDTAEILKWFESDLGAKSPALDGNLSISVSQPARMDLSSFMAASTYIGLPIRPAGDSAKSTAQDAAQGSGKDLLGWSSRNKTHHLLQQTWLALHTDSLPSHDECLAFMQSPEPAWSAAREYSDVPSPDQIPSHSIRVRTETGKSLQQSVHAAPAVDGASLVSLGMMNCCCGAVTDAVTPFAMSTSTFLPLVAASGGGALCPSCGPAHTLGPRSLSSGSDASSSAGGMAGPRAGPALLWDCSHAQRFCTAETERQAAKAAEQPTATAKVEAGRQDPAASPVAGATDGANARGAAAAIAAVLGKRAAAERVNSSAAARRNRSAALAVESESPAVAHRAHASYAKPCGWKANRVKKPLSEESVLRNRIVQQQYVQRKQVRPILSSQEPWPDLLWFLQPSMPLPSRTC
jgi:hypothetical protein